MPERAIPPHCRFGSAEVRNLNGANDRLLILPIVFANVPNLRIVGFNSARDDILERETAIRSTLLGLVFGLSLAMLIALANEFNNTLVTKKFEKRPDLASIIEPPKLGSNLFLPKRDSIGRPIDDRLPRAILIMPDCSSCAVQSVNLKDLLESSEHSITVVWSYDAKNSIPRELSQQAHHRFVFDTKHQVADINLRLLAPIAIVVDYRNVIQWFRLSAKGRTAFEGAPLK